MVRATLIATDGPYLEACLEVQGQRFIVMDEFSVSAETMPQVGDSFDFEFSAELDENQSWAQIFSPGHPQRQGLEHLAGWRYQAYGRVVSVAPVVVDCAVLQVEDVVRSSDPALIGEYVTFTITRLGGYPA